MPWATTGGSLTLATRSANVVAADAPAVSVPVRVTERSPTSALAGVPAKVARPASKRSQAGSGEPSARLAARVRWSPESRSGSLNVPLGSTRLKALPWVADWAATGVASCGGSLTLATLTVKVGRGAGTRGVGRGQADRQLAHVGIAGRACEGAGGRIEAEPGRQRGAVLAGGRQGQHVAIGRVGIAERAGRHDEGERGVLLGALVGDVVGRLGRIVGVGDDDVEARGCGSTGWIGRGHCHRDGAHVGVGGRALEAPVVAVEVQP